MKLHNKLQRMLLPKLNIASADTDLCTEFAVFDKTAEVHCLSGIGHEVAALRSQCGLVTSCTMQRDGEDSEAYDSYRRARVLRSQLMDVLLCCRKAIAINPNLAMAHYLLGVKLQAPPLCNSCVDAGCTSSAGVSPVRGSAPSAAGAARGQKAC